MGNCCAGARGSHGVNLGGNVKSGSALGEVFWVAVVVEVIVRSDSFEMETERARNLMKTEVVRGHVVETDDRIENRY